MKAIEAGNEMAALAMPKSEPVTHHIHATLNPTAETAAIIAHRYGCFEIERANIQAKTNAMAISGDDPIRSIRAHHRPSLPKRRSGRKPAPKLMRTAKMTRTRFKTAKGIVASTVLKCRISETFANRSARKKTRCLQLGRGCQSRFGWLAVVFKNFDCWRFRNNNLKAVPIGGDKVAVTSIIGTVKPCQGAFGLPCMTSNEKGRLGRSWSGIRCSPQF